MRILHLLSYAAFSGPVPPTVNLAHAQAAAGHRVLLAYDKLRDGFSPYEESVGPHIPALWSPSHPLGLGAKSGALQIVRDIRSLRAMCRKDLDIVHAHQTHDQILAAIGCCEGVPVVRTLHTARTLRQRGLRRFWWRTAHGYICRTAGHAALAQAWSPRTHVCCIPGSIPAADFQPAHPQPVALDPGCAQRLAAEKQQAQKRLGIPPGKQVLLHAAKMDARGHKQLISAAAHLGDPRLHLLFVGAGPDQGSLQHQIQRLGLQDACTFAGYVPYTFLSSVYKACDASFCAGPGNDASCRAVLEAMAFGKPVVGLSKAAVGELVRPTTGYPFPAVHTAALVSALRAWLSCPVDAAQRGETARIFVHTHRNIEREQRATDCFYQRVLERTGPNASGASALQPHTLVA